MSEVDVTELYADVKVLKVETADIKGMVHGDGGESGLIPRVNKLEERVDCTDQKTDDVDSMVHGDGGNSGLIARVNTLESQVKLLIVLMPIGATLLVGAGIVVSNFIGN